MTTPSIAMACACLLLAGYAREAPPPEAAVTASASPPVAAAATADLGPAVREALGIDGETHYFDARIDLNRDGVAEFVVYAAGPMACGTGGCPVFVFTPAAAGYRRVAQISVAQPPVRVSPRSHLGWRNLVVGVGGGGIRAGNAELRFDGESYASNPTVPPAEPLADLAGTQVLIPEFASYKEGKPVPAPAR